MLTVKDALSTINLETVVNASLDFLEETGSRPSHCACLILSGILGPLQDVTRTNQNTYEQLRCVRSPAGLTLTPGRKVRYTNGMELLCYSSCPRARLGY